MKIDLKTILILILGGFVLLLIGYILGQNNSSKSSDTKIPADAVVIKEYKESVSREIRTYGKEISSCYQEFLKQGPTKTEGKVDIVIEVQQTGMISKIEIAKNELADEQMDSCIQKKLSKLRLPPPPLGINPFIPHTLLFKSEETVKKEIEERKNQIPKVLPSN